MPRSSRDLADTFVQLLETDLQLMRSEADKLEGMMHKLAHMFSTTDVKALLAGIEAAQDKLHQLKQPGLQTLDPVRAAPVLLQPFLDACEVKNGKLVTIALATLQKFVANNAIGDEGRTKIISALSLVEKGKDESAQLRALQVAAALLQNPHYADDVDGVQQLLSLVFRLHSANKHSPSVLSSAAATIRQSVSLVFNHALLPPSTPRIWQPPAAPGSAGGAGGGRPPSLTSHHLHRGDDPGREQVALRVLDDLVAFCAQDPKAPATFLVSPPPSRAFALELLEAVLSHRHAAFHALPTLAVALRQKVCYILEPLLRTALDPKVDPHLEGEVKGVIKCAVAVVRRHLDLAPDKCSMLLSLLLRGTTPACTPWQRCAVLCQLRGLLTEAGLVYRLFEKYDQAMDFDLNAVTDAVRGLSDIVRGFIKYCGDNPEDDVLGALGALYGQKVAGKDLALDLDALGVVIPGAEVIIAYLALDGLLAVAAGLEVLTDQALQPADADSVTAAAGLNSIGSGSIVIAAEHQLQQQAAAAAAAGTPFSSTPASPAHGALTRASVGGAGSVGGSPDGRPLALAAAASWSPPPRPPASLDVCCNMADTLWRGVFSGISAVLTRAQGEPLVPVLLRAYQQYIYAAGKLGMRVALDGFLRSLCEFTLAAPDDPAMQQAEGASRAAGTAPALLNTSALADRDSVALTPRNTAALRSLFTVTSRLANALGSSWLHVMDVVTVLDRLLASPRTTLVAAVVQGQEGSEHTGDTSAGGPSAMARSAGSAGGAAGGGGPTGELSLLAGASNSLFEGSAGMSTEGVVSLLSALAEVSARSLPKEASVGGTVRLYGLNRMVQTLMYNLPRIQDLWGIFLGHTLEVLRSGNPQVRAAAIEALDRTITGALAPEATAGTASTSAAPAQMEDVQNMLLVALDSLYREVVREVDVRRGLLRTVVHVLQHHGETLTRGWLPLLRLLGEVPQQQDGPSITLGFQAAELLASDFLPALPKDYIPRALDVVAGFARQTQALNVALTAVTLLWNVADQLARTKRAAAAAAARQQALEAQEGGAQVAPASPAPAAAGVVGGRADVSQAESVELLMVAFRHLKSLCMDPRPEVRNSGMRTLFLAVGSHGAKFEAGVLRECAYELLLPLVRHAHHMSVTASATEVAASELGKDKGGKSVMMLQHHSRNTEQKQWEETLVLALGGTTKVMRAYLPALIHLEGFEGAWEDLMQVVGCVLLGGRKGTASAAVGLVTTLLTSHGDKPKVLQPWMWRQALGALDTGMRTMTAPLTPAPLQARTELLTGISQVYGVLREQMGPEDVRMVVGWLDRFARYPLGADDMAPPASSLSPVQKLVLTGISQLAPLPTPEVWPDVLGMLCAMLCPFRLMPYRQQQAQGSSPAPKSAAQQQQQPQLSPATSLASAPSIGGASADGDAACAAAGGRAALPPYAEDPAVEARCLSSLWMCRVCDQLSAWYKDQVPWQVRVATFPRVTSALSECMATRHTSPEDELWRCATSAFTSVVLSGLPSINIASHNQQQQVAPDTWPVLTRAFQMSLLGINLPTPAPAPEAAAGAASRPAAGTTPAPSASAAAALSDGEVQAAVLDCLSDGVLSSCQYAPADTRRELVAIIDSGAGAPQSWEGAAGAAARFSHMCLSKLYVLCSRGQEAAQAVEQSVRCQLEVAQCALPVFIARCDTVLKAYVAEQQRYLDACAAALASPRDTTSPAAAAAAAGGSDDGAPGQRPQAQPLQGPPGMEPLLTERALHVLELLAQLRITPPVMDQVLPSRPELRPWLDLVRARRRGATGATTPTGPGLTLLNVTGAAVAAAVAAGAIPGSASSSSGGACGADRKERTHLLALYGVLCECVGSPDARVRELVRQLLLAAGTELGLCSSSGSGSSGGKQTAGAAGEQQGAAAGVVPRLGSFQRSSGGGEARLEVDSRSSSSMSGRGAGGSFSRSQSTAAQGQQSELQ